MTKSSSSQDPRYNAVKHGLTARRLLLREEEVAEFAAFRDDWFREWCPRGQAECAAVYEMAEAQWRLLRISPIEAELLESLRHPDSEVGGLAAAFLGGKDADGNDLLRLARYRRTIERSYDRALHDLLLLHRARGVWSRPEVPQARAEPKDWLETVPACWRAEVAQAEPMPPRDEEAPTVTVESFVIGDQGEEIPSAEWERRQQEERIQAASDAVPVVSPSAPPPSQEAPAGPAIHTIPPQRPNPDILRNGRDFQDGFENLKPESHSEPTDLSLRHRR